MATRFELLAIPPQGTNTATVEATSLTNPGLRESPWGHCCHWFRTLDHAGIECTCRLPWWLTLLSGAPRNIVAAAARRSSHRE